MNNNYKFKTLVEMLLNRAQSQPRVRAFTFEEYDTSKSHLTYGELHCKAVHIASILQSKGPEGGRVLLLFPAGLDFISAFFGCLYAKFIAIPTFPPRNNHNALRVRSIALDSGAQICLANTAVIKNISEIVKRTPELKSLIWLNIDETIGPSDTHWKKPILSSEDLAILQYTSGSTDSPKGVMVSHGNFLHNLSFSHERWQLSNKTKLVTWLPFFHDMGLVAGVLLPVYGCFHCFVMAPTTFLRKPIRWLRAISQEKATISIAPNFAYNLCAEKMEASQKLDLDLSSWENAINGSESINFHALERFNQSFSSCGFKPQAMNPGYGLAEATLVVTVGNKETIYHTKKLDKNEYYHKEVPSNPNIDHSKQTIVGCGTCAPDQKIIIVNPETCKACKSNEIGEIWISGRSVAMGYWNNPVKSKEIFKAYLAESNDGPYLRTGDLGFLDGEELYVTGRLKELIIIRGINYYPQDIERAVQDSHAQFLAGCGVAFSVNVDGEEELVLVQEVERAAKFKIESMVAGLQQRIFDEFGLRLYALLIVRSHSIPKTSSSKLQRQLCKKAFVQEKLKVLQSWWVTSSDQHSRSQSSPLRFKPGENFSKSFDPTKDLHHWLTHYLAKKLNIPTSEIDSFKSFAKYGIDSAESITLIGELEKMIKRDLEPSLIFDYPTINSLCNYLSEKGSQDSCSSKKSNEPAKDPIAIIGMGCRFPGAGSPSQFWNNLTKGVDSVTEVPDDRWAIDDLYHADPDIPGKMNTKWGGFLENIDQFDPPFFEISPKEARNMDPQQRLLLEVVWEALEHAGEPPQDLCGTQTGVYVGVSTHDYAFLQYLNRGSIDAYTGTGSNNSITANRISYFLDLKGPSIAVDTACSSSLVAVHLACENLSLGKTNLAIAGGVNLMVTPELTIALSKAHMMSADGKCKTFDKQANGYVRGEGCGVVILKRLSDAIRDRNTIYSVVYGSAINQDGKSNGLTAPNGPSQEAVIETALRQANIEPHKISYIECHGTGTSLGDPQEANALKNILGKNRDRRNKCVLGSVKTNIGHLEAASGIAGLIKTVLAIKNDIIPPNLHIKSVNPLIRIGKSFFKIPRNPTSWPNKKDPFAGVSSFGFGGSNSHVILGKAPFPIAKKNKLKVEKRNHHVLVLSAKSQRSLEQIKARFCRHLKNCNDASLGNICYTSSVGRSHFSYRMAVSGDSISQIVDRLESISEGEKFNEISISNGQQKLAFLFTGQGSQYTKMGYELYQTNRVFKNALDMCSEIARPILKKSLINLIFEPENRDSLNLTRYTQPVVFATEYALATYWKSLGIVPQAVFGHSIGDYAAACVAGVFSVKDAIRLVIERAELLSNTTNGMMVVILTERKTIEELIKPYDDVAIAAYNGPPKCGYFGRN